MKIKRVKKIPMKILDCTAYIIDLVIEIPKSEKKKIEQKTIDSYFK